MPEEKKEKFGKPQLIKKKDIKVQEKPVEPEIAKEVENVSEEGVIPAAKLFKTPKEAKAGEENLSETPPDSPKVSPKDSPKVSKKPKEEESPKKTVKRVAVKRRVVKVKSSTPETPSTSDESKTPVPPPTSPDSATLSSSESAPESAPVTPASASTPTPTPENKDKPEPLVIKKRQGVQQLEEPKRRVPKVGTGRAGNLSQKGGTSGRTFGTQAKPAGQKAAPPAGSSPNSDGTEQKDGKRVFRKKGAARSGGPYRSRAREERDKAFAIKKSTVAPANPVPKEINIMESITISDLARKMNLRGSDLISKLMGMGMMININQPIDSDTATLLADEFKCKVNVVSLYDETIIEREEDVETEMRPRAPIVTVMGHVDHGKTSLLDAIRKSKVTEKEHGGITQHIAAYSVETEQGASLTFLDTPGHEAFSLMRVRGAQITDIVVLAVAADDGVMPQTVEAINHAKEAGVPILVAVTKVDLPEANLEKIKTQLSEHELIAEDWGGSTQIVEVSVFKDIGIKKLLETILLEAELLELKANWNCLGEGRVIESQVEQGRGITATVIVERGTLHVGDAFVAGVFSGKIRGMFNSDGDRVKEAIPSMPVEITGFSGAPYAGDPFQTTKSEKEAKGYSQKRVELKRTEEAQKGEIVTLDNLYTSIQAGNVNVLKIIVKGDVQGSVEAIQNTLERLSTDEIQLRCIHVAAGAVVESDVQLAIASKAILIGFHVHPTPRAQAIIEAEKIEFRRYNVIYEIVEDMTNVLEGMLDSEFEEVEMGTAEIRNIFKASRLGEIAGCMMLSGKIKRSSQIHLLRKGEKIFTGSLASLQREQDSVKEVKEGYECGMVIADYDEPLQENDIIQAFTMKEIRKKL